MKKRNGKGLKEKLMAYSGLAAGVLAIAPAAEAAVVYSGPRDLAVNGTTTPVAVDMDGNGTPEFVSGTLGSVIVALAGASFIDSMNYAAPHFGVANLAPTYNIQNVLAAPRLWRSGYGVLAATAAYSAIYGNFNRRTGFIGVRFTGDCSPGMFHYGWIRFRGMTGVSGRIVDWAYENTCDAGIRSGAGAPRTAQTTAVPTVNAWGAIGMAGLLAGAAVRTLRRKKTTEEE